MATSLLKQVTARVDASVPKTFRQAYQKIVAAGKQLMFSDQTFGMMQDYMRRIQNPQDIPKIVSHGIVKVISMLFNESQGTLSLEAAGPAAIVLMADALEYVEQVAGIPVTKDIVDATTLLIKDGLLVFIKQASKISEPEWQSIVTRRPGGETTRSNEAGSASPEMPPNGGM